MTLRPIPKGDELEWKEVMLERYARITDVARFKEYSLSFLRKSVRINTLKKPLAAVKASLENDWRLTPIPWCEHGFWVEHKQGRLDIGNTMEHALGYIYVQEAASMLPPLALAPEPGETVLDMCAAPGSKSTQLAQQMENTGVLVCNDVTADRLAALGTNLQRCGVSNCVVTQMHGMKDLQFDRILIDAPCSGTGTIRKSLRTLRTWSLGATHKLCKSQRELMARAWSMLKPGGTFVYSTCSLEPEEDEGMVSSFLQHHKDADLAPIELDIKKAASVMEWDGETFDERVKHTLRVWPQDNDTEGFFVAKIVKPA